MTLGRPTYLSLLALAVAAPASGAEWTRSAGVSVGTYYSNNICLVQRNEEEKAVGTVTPRIDLRGEGSRATTSLQAAVEYNTIGDSSLECPERGGGLNPANRETWIPRVNFLSEFEAVEDLFYLEADAFAAQNPLNPFAAGGEDNINATGNQNISYRWGVGGRLERQFDSEWALFARYNYNEQYNSFNRLLGDTQENRVDLDIGKIPGTSRLSYGISGQYSEVDFEETETRPEFSNRLSRLGLRSALQMTDEWQVNGYLGEEDNVFVSQSDEIDGTIWDAGLRWTPNSRVTMDVGYGERFFGEAPRFSVSYRHKRSEWRASYLRDFRFPRNLRVSDQAFAPDDPFNPGLGDPGDPLGAGGDPTFVGQSPILDERFTLAYVFTGRQTTISITASDSKQTRAVDGRQGDFQSASINFNRQLARNLSFDAGVNWRDNEGNLGIGGGGLQNLEGWRATLGLRRNLTNDTSVIFRYRHTDQTSAQTFNTFTENRLEVTFSHDF